MKINSHNEWDKLREIIVGSADGTMPTLTWEKPGEIPKEIGNLHNLELLFLDYNNISGGIPSELGNLTTLDYLYLYFNKLSGKIPESICDLSIYWGNQEESIYINRGPTILDQVT